MCGPLEELIAIRSLASTKRILPALAPWQHRARAMPLVGDTDLLHSLRGHSP